VSAPNTPLSLADASALGFAPFNAARSAGTWLLSHGVAFAYSCTAAPTTALLTCTVSLDAAGPELFGNGAATEVLVVGVRASTSAFFDALPEDDRPVIVARLVSLATSDPELCSLASGTRPVAQSAVLVRSLATCPENTYFVDPAAGNDAEMAEGLTWATAFPHLQAALDRIGAWDGQCGPTTVAVARGTDLAAHAASFTDGQHQPLRIVGGQDPSLGDSTWTLLRPDGELTSLRGLETRGLPRVELYNFVLGPAGLDVAEALLLPGNQLGLASDEPGAGVVLGRSYADAGATVRVRRSHAVLLRNVTLQGASGLDVADLTTGGTALFLDGCAVREGSTVTVGNIPSGGISVSLGQFDGAGAFRVPGVVGGALGIVHTNMTASGALVVSGSVGSLALYRCRFVDGVAAEGEDGGAFNVRTAGDTTLEDCTFAGNQAPGHTVVLHKPAGALLAFTGVNSFDGDTTSPPPSTVFLLDEY
jgi:hypothetical protein